MAERFDVCIVGSGFGGSIAAWRLAELYRATDANASVVMLERGKRKGHTDFHQSMDVDNLSDVYSLVQGQGAQIVMANLVGGGSNLYLAASLRSPSETFERTDVHPDDGPRRRLWPAALSRGALDPFYKRAENGLRVTQPSWREVSKSGRDLGRDAAQGRLHVRPRSADHQLRSAASTRSGATRAASSAPRTR